MDRYSPEGEDIVLLIDPIRAILRSPKMYLGGEGKPSGELLAARLMHTLILLDALPAQVSRSDSWWIIRSDKDWLLTEDAVLQAFTRILPFPEAGVNAMRDEVLLTAFADAVVIIGSTGVQWIKEAHANFALPAEVESANPGQGRVVAFLML